MNTTRMNCNSNNSNLLLYFSDGQTEVVSSSEQIVETVEDAPTEIIDEKQENDHDEQGTANT